jgi:hypothetical protein
MNKILKFFLLNIHTILLFVGIAFIVVSAFLFNLIVGYLILGIGCIVASLLINQEMG